MKNRFSGPAALASERARSPQPQRRSAGSKSPEPSGPTPVSAVSAPTRQRADLDTRGDPALQVCRGDDSRSRRRLDAVVVRAAQGREGRHRGASARSRGRSRPGGRIASVPRTRSMLPTRCGTRGCSVPYRDSPLSLFEDSETRLAACQAAGYVHAARRRPVVGSESGTPATAPGSARTARSPRREDDDDRRPDPTPNPTRRPEPFLPHTLLMTTPPSVAPRTMRIRLHLKPGQKGTKQLLAQYGDRLICVRYRYDAQRKKRFKTVELLVAERDWEPPRTRIEDDQIVALRVAFAEVAVRERVKQAGGKWDPDRKVWEIRYDQAVALGLDTRIVDEPASTSRCREERAGYLYVDAWPTSRTRCSHTPVDASISWQMPALQSNSS
jgi:hypothetical protein